ncbi:unnamed protein product [Adineta steineri]|uniref:NHL repeat containing protein n=2 Tax=Adineta steineri TaxID=433720 RepID=A0A815YHW9_9BILA|nr:unnamed protein product [Adineta steineri]CAF1571930.1 unnamed protein product [Adineta steineri]
MEIDGTVDADESIVVNLNQTRLQRLCEHFRKRKLIWTIVLIILIVAIIVNPIVIVTMNKGKREKTSTIQITTVEIITATAAHITTEKIAAATAGKPEQITTTEKTTQIATEKTTQIATETTATEELIPLVIINEDTKWKQSATTVAGGNKRGDGLNQLKQPLGIYVDEDSESIYIADTDNNRIVRWKFGAKNGTIVAGGNGQGDNIDQLRSPTDIVLNKEKTSLIICDSYNKRVIRWSLQNSQSKEILISDISCWGLAIHNNGDLYISDYKKHQIRRLQQGDKEATIVVGYHGQGNQLNQLNEPMYIFVDKNHSIYVADCANNRVMKWMKNAFEGTLVAPGKASGESLNSLKEPIGVIVDHVGNIYVSNSYAFQIKRWSPGAKEGVPVVGEEKIESDGPTELSHPYDLSFDRQGNLYVLSYGTNRLQKFVIDVD